MNADGEAGCIHEEVAKRIPNVRFTTDGEAGCIHEEVAKRILNVRFTDRWR